MYFYYFTILFLFFPAFFETAYPASKGKIPLKNAFIWFVIVILIVEMGFRWETGTDWTAYFNHFNSQDLATPFVNHENNFEGGYNFFVSIIKSVIPEYSFFLIVHSVIFFILLKKAYTFFTPYSLVALLLFFVTFLGIWGSNRQLVAGAIGLLGLTYLYEKKWWAYAVCVVLAFQFHSTSILLLVFIFFRRRFNDFVIITSVLACLAIGYSPLPTQIFSLFGGFNAHAASKTEIYLEKALEDNNAVTIIGLLKRISIFTLFFIYRKRITIMFPKFNFIFNVYFVSLCFYFIFANSLTVMVSRGSFYFNILEPVLLSYSFYLVKDRKKVFLMILVLLFYCFLTINQSIATYPELFDPYKGLFINTSYYRNMY